MKLKMNLPLILIALCLLLAGCGGRSQGGAPAPSASPPADGGPVHSGPAETQEHPAPERPGPVWPLTFTDGLDRAVTLGSPPQRVAALTSSFAQVWLLAGGDVIAVPNDAWSSYALELDESVADIGSPHDLSLEALLAAEPDFVIATGNVSSSMEFLPTFERMGIPAAYFDVNTFDDYLRMLKTCVSITGRQELYEQNGLAVKERVDAALGRAAQHSVHPRVLCLRASASSVSVKGTGDTVLAELLSDLGCVNIADADSALLEELSLERIVEADPDYIFIAPMGTNESKIQARLESDLISNPAWNGLTAVREGRVHVMDRMLYTLKPNERWGEAYEGLEAILFAQAAD